MTLDQLKQQLPAIVRERPAVVKALCPFAMTLSQRLHPHLWRWVVYLNEDFVVFVIPKRTKSDAYHEFLDIANELTSDWLVL